MIKDEQLPELAAFRTLEADLPLWYTPKYGGLVVSSRNDEHPVHRWFRFKEGYAADLLETVLATLDLPQDRELMLLDPFCGSGTTLLSAENLRSKGWNFCGFGIEVNPFIAFVANTKVNWSRIHPKRFLEAGEAALLASKHASVSLPKLTSISEGRCISRTVARRLIALRDVINETRFTADRHALLLGLAASIEPLSKVRKDGRALRIVSKSPVNFEAVIRAHWNQIANDVEAQPYKARVRANMTVVHGDGRSPADSGVTPGSIDLIVTSPPYPNNIDYTEVYKLELWLMGFVSSASEFLTQRRHTLRSHPTAAPLPASSDLLRHLESKPLNSILRPLLLRMTQTHDTSRRRLLLGYCADLFEAMKQHYTTLKPGGYEVLVVGNSLHGSGDHAFLLPSDLLIAAMAPIIGFEVQEVNIARGLKRRLSGNHFLRESVVVLRKPHGR